MVELKPKNIATQADKLLMIFISNKWGLNNSTLSWKCRNRIARASSRIVAYDNGYLKEFSTKSIIRWEKDVDKSTKDGVSSNHIATNKYTIKIAHTTRIEETYPGYLHYLFRKATKLRGPKAGFGELAVVMNETSHITTEFKLDVWFKSNDGKEISPKEKPLDSQEHCELRKAWVIKYYGLLTCAFSIVCFIDEKWFYRTNRRQKRRR